MERILCMEIADKYTKSTKICHNQVCKLAAYEISFLHYSIGYNYVGSLHTNLPLNINKSPQWPILKWAGPL